MFKLLAIRPLEGCADYIQKCLKTGLMYYFCNDYIIEPGSHIRRRSKNIKPLKEDFFTVVSESDYSEDNSSERKSPTVSVSAIVGMNGDGKSTLVELMMRLINNCAISYELCASSDNGKGENDNKTEPHYNLRRVKNAKAELYYMIDNVVYRMAEEKDQKETRIWKVSELNSINEKGEEIMRWEIDSVEIQKVEDDPKGFFFTIVSNYSHYAYNIYDYRKEWEIRGGEKDDDEKCWLHYVFHKNDGYLTPITLHPYRCKGNIDINVEKDLSKQRLLSLFLNAENPKENDHSFRSVNGKDANVLKLTEVTESKLQQRTIIEYFNTENQKNKYKELLDEIDIANEILVETMLINSDDVYNKNSNHLFDTLDIAFIKPINQIIEQDDDFCIFANEIADWMKEIYKNKKKQYNGDIITVLRHYENQFYGKESFQKISECDQKAIKSLEVGDYALALEYFEEAIEISENDLGKAHVFTALVLNDVAVIYDYLCDYDKALEYYLKAIAIKESKLSSDHPSIATTYSNMASAFRSKGEYDKAFDCCNRALPIMESRVKPLQKIKICNNIAIVCEDLEKYGEALKYCYEALSISGDANLGEDNLVAAKIYNTIAIAYHAKKDHDKALEFFLKVLEIKKKVLGARHIDTAVSCDNIAFVYYEKGNLDKALKYYKDSLMVRKKELGTWRLDTAISYDNIAMVYYNKNKLDDALKYYKDTLEIRKKVLGVMHLDIAISYDNIAKVHYGKSDFDEALTNYRNALKIRENILGKDHIDTARTYHNLAGICVVLGRKYNNMALRNYEKAMKTREIVLGRDHPDTATTYNNIALLFVNMYNYDSALSYFSAALEIRKKTLGKDSLKVAATYDNRAVAYKLKNNHDKALANYRHALSIRQKVLGEDNLDTIMSYCKVGWEYYYTGNYGKALNNFRIVLERREKNLGEEHSGTIKYYKIIAGVYKKMGDYDKAWEYHNKGQEKSKLKNGEYVPDATPNYNLIEDPHYDKTIEKYEKNELILQLSPDNIQRKIHVDKENMDKILENYYGVEKIRNTKNQELIDTNKYSFLKTINAAQLGRLDTLYRIIKAYNNYYKKDRNKIIETEIVAKSYSKLTLMERCQHYIIYKIWSVLSTYPPYQKSKEKDGVASIREYGLALEESVKDILNDTQSHITRKIRQVENFMNEGLQMGGLYERLGTKEKKSGALLVELDKLKKHYKDKNFSLDHLPPPIYKWDIIFNKKDDPNCKIELDSFSSGEKQQLYSIGAIVYHLQNLANTSSGVNYNNVNLVMEEMELYYHPEYQRLFLIRLLDSIRRANLGNMRNINVVFVTHSPFVLSDIPKCNVLFLKDGMPDDELQENTFGANIHSLLKHGFFMPNLPIGEFAYEKINALFKKLNTGDFNNDDEEKRKKELNDIYQQILLVGEPFLRNQLLLLYNSFKGSK